MMQPWQKAKQWHIRTGSTVPFEAVLGIFIRDGYVWSSPTEFVLAREIALNGDGKLNCWFVHLAAGTCPLKRFLELAPHQNDYVAWQRRGNKKMHIFSWEKFASKVGENLWAQK